MKPFVELFLILLSMAQFVIIAQAIMSWLLAFNVLDRRNQIVSQIWGTLNMITEPVYRPLRRFVPPISGMDITPIIVLLGIFFLRSMTMHYIWPIVP